MKSRKLIGVYTGLLIIAVATMIMLWRLKTMPKAEVFPRDYPEIKEEGILRLVTEYNQSGYYVAGDTIEGFQYELSQAIAQLSGLEIQIFLEMSLAESFDMLEENNCDAVARNIPITSEIKEKYLFTEPIVLDKQVLIQRTEAANNGLKPIRNQLDLAGKTLYIPKDSPAQLRLQNLGHEIGDTIYVIEDELYSGEQLAIMVAKGDIDYAVCDQQTAALVQEHLADQVQRLLAAGGDQDLLGIDTPGQEVGNRLTQRGKAFGGRVLQGCGTVTLHHGLAGLGERVQGEGLGGRQAASHADDAGAVGEFENLANG